MNIPTLTSKPFVLPVCCLVLAVGLGTPSRAARIVADMRDDYQETTEPANWSYQWCLPSDIGDSSKYADLSWSAGDYGGSWVSGEKYLHVKAAGRHPGGDDGYAITGFTVSESGAYTLGDGQATFGVSHGNPDGDGVEVRVYVNDTHKLTQDVHNETYLFNDLALGVLKPNDAIYVALGTNGTSSYDWTQLDYIVSVPEPASLALLVLGSLIVARRR